MDLAKLELRPPDHRQPYHLAAHFTYGRGVGAPIVAVLWFRAQPGEGDVGYPGWQVWVVSESPDQPQRIDPDLPPIEALRRAMKLLADQPAPSFDRERSIALIEEHLYSTEPDFPLPFP